MKSSILSVVSFLLLCATFARAEGELKHGAYRISGPYVHENLTIYLVHSESQPNAKPYITLGEAMEQKKVVVHETGNVNELAVENVSEDHIYIQSGDIVKGGKQDRTLADDLVLAPKSGKVPIDSFCVESGRWRQRGEENTAMFAGSSNNLASRELKLAAKQEKEQGRVWAEVSRMQAGLASNASFDASSTTSPTSLELTLDDKAVKEGIAGYEKKLATITDGKNDVIGYAFAINGQLNSADLYASNQLFTKLWPKLIKATCVEALAKAEKEKTYQPLPADKVTRCLSDPDATKAKEETLNDSTVVVTQEEKEGNLYETRDQQAGGGWVHRNYIAK